MRIRREFNLKDMLYFGLATITAGAIAGYGTGNYRGFFRGYNKAEKDYLITETEELLKKSLKLNRKLVKELYGNDDRLPNLLNLDYKSKEE